MRSTPTFRGASTLTKSVRAASQHIEPYFAAFSCQCEVQAPCQTTQSGLSNSQ